MATTLALYTYDSVSEPGRLLLRVIRANVLRAHRSAGKAPRFSGRGEARYRCDRVLLSAMERGVVSVRDATDAIYWADRVARSCPFAPQA